MQSQNILKDKNNENTITECFNNFIGNDTTFKYQCPSIIEKNTTAVIIEFISITISALVGFTDGIRFGNIFANTMHPIILIVEII